MLGSRFIFVGPMPIDQKSCHYRVWSLSKLITIADWSFNEPCSREHTIELLADNPSLADEVNRFAANRKVFFGKEPTSSVSGFRLQSADKSGISRRTHLEQVYKQTDIRPKRLDQAAKRPEEAVYLWVWFCDLAAGCEQAITWQDISAWTEISGATSSSDEAQVLLRLAHIRFSAQCSPSPTTPTPRPSPAGSNREKH